MLLIISELQLTPRLVVTGRERDLLSHKHQSAGEYMGATLESQHQRTTGRSVPRVPNTGTEQSVRRPEFRSRGGGTAAHLSDPRERGQHLARRVVTQLVTYRPSFVPH